MPRRTDGWKNLFIAASIALLLGFVSISPSSAQNDQDKKTKQEERKKPDLGTKPPQGKDFKIGVSVDLVVVHTTVTDKNGKFVSGLKKDTFRIHENGIAQNIQYFSQEDVPISLGIVIDTSGSMRSKFDSVTRAALSFIRAGNPDDEEFLIGFNDEVELLEDYTNDIDLITDSLNNTVVSGGTALWDAIYLSVQKAQSGSKPKKALVVISDGEDKDSYYKLDEMVAKVQESDVQIYSIGFLSPEPDQGLFGRWVKSEPEKARAALQKISEESGARAYFPKDVTEIHDIVAQIAYELRNQYSIAYTSSNPAKDGTWRRIKVALEPPPAEGMKVRYRAGYFSK